MFQKPVAADFECLFQGKILAWNHAYGLSARWLAAQHVSADVTPEQACEIVNRNLATMDGHLVTVRVRKD